MYWSCQVLPAHHPVPPRQHPISCICLSGPAMSTVSVVGSPHQRIEQCTIILQMIRAKNHLVICLPLLRVLQDLICLIDFLELLRVSTCISSVYVISAPQVYNFAPD